jgi:hypothetical protein
MNDVHIASGVRSGDLARTAPAAIVRRNNGACGRSAACSSAGRLACQTISFERLATEAKHAQDDCCRSCARDGEPCRKCGCAAATAASAIAAARATVAVGQSAFAGTSSGSAESYAPTDHAAATSASAASSAAARAASTAGGAEIGNAFDDTTGHRATAARRKGCHAATAAGRASGQGSAARRCVPADGFTEPCSSRGRPETVIARADSAEGCPLHCSAGGTAAPSRNGAASSGGNLAAKPCSAAKRRTAAGFGARPGSASCLGSSDSDSRSAARECRATSGGPACRTSRRATSGRSATCGKQPACHQHSSRRQRTSGADTRTLGCSGAITGNRRGAGRNGQLHDSEHTGLAQRMLTRDRDPPRPA